MTKRITVYRYPSLYGSPKEFRFRFMAMLYGFWCTLCGYVVEMENNA